MVYKAEAPAKGLNTRFVVTTHADPWWVVHDVSVDRGKPEQWIEQLKASCFADRLSCCAF